MTAYDDGESFTAGDNTAIHFDNDALIALFLLTRAVVPSRRQQRLIRLAILRAIFGAAEDR